MQIYSSMNASRPFIWTGILHPEGGGIVLSGSKSFAIFVLSRAVVESAGNEIRSTVSLPLPGSSSLHKYLD